MADVTRLLQAIEEGDGSAAEELLPLVYEDLRRLAALRMAAESPGHTLQPTALVHEAWLRIAGEDHAWQNRRHFFAAAAEAMRRILIDRARRRLRVRHGGGLERADVDAIQVPDAVRDDQLLAVDEALSALEQEDPRRAQVVKLKYFVGLTNPEVAEAMGLSLATVERDWAFAKAWLFSRIQAPT
jgi:RNA polymerase sigma factor (TIGR02999 family)